MATCEVSRPAPFRCPSIDESITATLALLPQGRAWPAHDAGMFARFSIWLAGRAPDAAPEYPAGFVQIGFFAALGAARNYVEKRLCDLRLEFWCATQAETNDLWMAEYGLPDGCDPFPDLCAKVAARGEATCEYYVAAAARIGWEIDCAAILDDCGAAAGCSFAGDDGAVAGNTTPAPRILIRVDLAKSAAYVGGYSVLPYAGCTQAGESLACEPDIAPLICLLDRIVHAHVEVVYQIIPPPTYIMVDADTNLATESGALLITG